DGRLHQHVLAGTQRRERDDQLRQVAQRRVEQTADGIARLGGDGFGGVTEQRCQRHDGEHGQKEEQRVFRCDHPLTDEHDGNKQQEPQKRSASDVFENVVHRPLPTIYPPSTIVMSTSTTPSSVRPLAMRSDLPPTNCPQRMPSRKTRVSATTFSPSRSAGSR